MEHPNANILIIGAGPAGLATAGRLRQSGIDFNIIEKTDKIGWSWHNHYDRLHLHTVKDLSALPGLPFPENYPTYVSRVQFVTYLQDYARHFNIKPVFNQKVTSIKKGNGHWVVNTQDKAITAQHVIIATGVNHAPNLPNWPGQSEFKGTITHSCDYRNPKPYLGKKVLVVGIGNTGAEIALDLANHNVETYISVRSPVSIVPRDVFGRPIQVTAKKLAKVPFGIGDWIGSQIRKLIIGNLEPYGLPISKIHPMVQVKTLGKTPIIDIGTAALIKSGKIKILPNFSRFLDYGIELENGIQHQFDDVILATGFNANLEALLDNTEGLFNQFGLPKSPIGQNEHQGLYFVGFDKQTIGGILGTIYNDSLTVVERVRDGGR